MQEWSSLGFWLVWMRFLEELEVLTSIGFFIFVKTDWLSLIPSIGTPVAALTLFAACFALFYNASAGHAQLFLTLRDRHEKIHKEMPKGPPPANDYHDPKWWPDPKEKGDFENIEHYWYQTFDEWFTTKKMHPLWFKPLWTKFYKEATYKGLRNRPIRRVLYVMIKNRRSSFSGLDKEFVTDMEALYKGFTQTDQKKKEDPSDSAKPPTEVIKPEPESSPCPGFSDKSDPEYRQFVESIDNFEMFRCCKYPWPGSSPSEPAKTSQAEDSSRDREGLAADNLNRNLTIAQVDKEQSLPHIGLVGDTYTITVSGDDTAGRFCVIDMHIPPGGGPPPHRHDFEEAFILLEGEIEATFRGKKSVVLVGDTVNIPANAPHQFHNASSKPTRLLCICSPAGQENFFIEVGVPVATRTTPPPELDEKQQAEFIRKVKALAPKYRTELLREA